MEYQDDDDDEKAGIYENGHWFWDDKNEQLVFKNDLPEMPDVPITTAILGALEFREDIDLNEQQRFRKRMQRKTAVGEADVVTLQDVKDVVLFTAPVKILQPLMISLLHQPATERLLRALIFFCQYYLQIADLMLLRKTELETKVRTTYSDLTELEFRENLEDLRLLVAKEYSNLLTGSAEFSKFHHMGAQKKSRSLSKRESLQFETFLRFCIQIVWIALGRKSFTQIELEVNRIFKSPTFNSAEHRLTKDAKMKMKEISLNERNVFLGHCMDKKRKVNMLSPLLSEVHYSRDIDYEMYGLGYIKYPWLNPRLYYMECALAMPEHLLDEVNMSVGILGLPRSRFDVLLKEIKFQTISSTSNVSITRSPPKLHSGKTGKRKSCIVGPLFNDITIPPKNDKVLSSEFPTAVLPRRPCNEVQRKKWMIRILRIAAKHRRKSQHF